jgi:aryl-alcohol dehydrogenase-like predicted oxidoreductase
VAAIKQAVARGVAWIDTAGVYGHGHSEEVVGLALREIPANDRPLVFTKGGHRYVSATSSKLYTDLRPETLRDDCEQSLRRLRIDSIDLYQIHWPNDETGTPLEESWGAMAGLQDEGKVRLIGASNFSVSQLERCERIRHVDSLQPPLSIIHPDALTELVPHCVRVGTGVIVYSPLRSGLLTEEMTAERVAAMPEGDWRRGYPDFQPPNLERNLHVRDALVPIARRRGVTVGTIAVAWVLAQKGVTGAIVGARRPDQLAGWLPAATFVLESDELEEIDGAKAEIARR